MGILERPNLDDVELIIISTASQKTKRGDDYKRMNLKSCDNKTNLSAIVWSNDLRKFREEKIFRSGNIIRLLDYDLPSNYSDYIVHDFVLVKEGKIGLSETERETIYKAIEGCIEEIEDKKLKDFVKSLMKDYGEAFKVAPAAKVMHHNYLGGLLEHTYECLDIAKDFLAKFPNKVDKGILYAACILHDFGKIWEYEINLDNGVIGYNNDFTSRWISHSQWGFSTCMTAGFEVVAKMIATHHGRADWGAVIDLDTNDLEPIYYLLNHIDDLSAKFGKTTVMDI